jgi:hypothetical protein
MIGPLPTAPGGFNRVLVAIDKFTKLIEVKLVTCPKADRVLDFRYVSVAHPRANGQVEHANGMLLDALKKRLHDVANTKGGKWIKELPNALWGLRTQPSKPTG